MTPEIARWLRDEVLAQVAYNGKPDELRMVLHRHDIAVQQLTDLADPIPPQTNKEHP